MEKPVRDLLGVMRALHAAAISPKSNDMRVCQIISNAMTVAGWPDNDFFYVEDQQLIAALEKWAKS